MYLTKLMKKFDLLVDVSDKSGYKYIVPCMLCSKRTKVSQQEIPYKLLIGSFPQLVSKCSKERDWNLCQDNLSYTTASFNIGKDMKLHLSLTVSGEVQTSIDWPKHIKQQQREVFQGDVTTILSRILKTCRNQTNPDEGNVLLLINVFRLPIFIQCTLLNDKNMSIIICRLLIYTNQVIDSEFYSYLIK